MKNDILEMEKLITSYLNFARGEGEEAGQPVDLIELLKEVIAQNTRNGKIIDLHIRDKIGKKVVIKPIAFQRVLTNLLGNSKMHATNISITYIRLQKRFLEIIIDDDGCGIPPDKVEEMFNLFTTGKKRDTNAGLGLPIARDIIRGHGGDLILSKSPMGGLRAKISLPV